MRVLVAPDSFKGTLSSREAAEAIARGLRAHWPDAEIEFVPLSDGWARVASHKSHAFKTLRQTQP